MTPEMINQILVDYGIKLSIGAGILLLLQFLLGMWLKTRLTESIRAEYLRQLEDYKNTIKIREQAARVAELFALAYSQKEDPERFNRIAWELSLWLPKDIVCDISRCLAKDKGAPHFKEILVSVRKILLQNRDDELVADNILHQERLPQINLMDKANAFAKQLAEGWTDSEAWDARAYQMRYLYSNAYRAAHVAQAFWQLYLSRRFHECHIVACSLLERIIKGKIAKISPERALLLMTSELAQEIAEVKKWKSLEKIDHTNVDTYLASHEQKLGEFLNILGLQKAPEWDLAALMKEVNLEFLYTTAYRELSKYTHANFSISAPGYGDQDSEVAQFVALLAPLDAATSFDAARNGGTSKEVYAAYKALYEEVATATVRKGDTILEE